MKISILTVSFNSAETIEDTIVSVLSHNYSDIEYLIIDGGSTDGTLDIINNYANKISKIISERDDGIYDAMNKGINLANGTIIGILNADDFYASSDILSNVIELMESQKLDAVYGDLVYVDQKDTSKQVRFWQAGNYKPGAFRKGWVPPHPTFFCRRSIYEKYGYFRKDMRIAADFELMLRFIERYKIKIAYLPDTMVKMRTGGKAYEWKSRIAGNIEILRSFKLNKLKPSPFFFINKPLSKIAQILSIKRPF